MINFMAFLKTAGVIGGYFAIRVIAGWRVERRERAALTTRLVDPILLETTFAPREGDDPNLLAEVRDTLAHLNRRAFAEEFWNVSDQIVALDKKLPKKARSTLRAALLRMLDTDDRWLRIVAAKSSGALKVEDAEPRLQALIDSLTAAAAADERFRTVLTEALDELKGIDRAIVADR